ncbi:MAG: hypothetical protein OYL97_22670 [Candidatus Poribacteria bacterium]|nr:hypothetical protein [Candidatus Poribacteria bacterium]
MITVEKRLVSQIIHQIDEVIRDTRTSQEKKIENLPNLAMTCWQEVVPEYGNPGTSQHLESAEVQKRWAKVRDEVEKYETKSPILYVLDWPASSGDFYWVK